MKAYPLFDEQAAHYGGNFAIEIESTDLTATGNTQTISTGQTLTANRQGLMVVNSIVVTPFVSSDGTLISTAFTVGDSGSATRQLASTETNAAGTVRYNQTGALTGPYVPTADTLVNVYATATVAKALNTHTSGKLLLICRRTDRATQR